MPHKSFPESYATSSSPFKENKKMSFLKLKN